MALACKARTSSSEDNVSNSRISAPKTKPLDLAERKIIPVNASFASHNASASAISAIMAVERILADFPAKSSDITAHESLILTFKC